MIDWSRVKILCKEVGREDFEEVIVLFFEEMDGMLDKLRQSPDLLRLEGDLHFLKGSALNFGFTRFSKLCEAGESMCARGQASLIELDPIFLSFDRSRALFEEEYRQHMLS